MEKALPVGTGVTVVGELANITLAVSLAKPSSHNLS